MDALLGLAAVVSEPDRTGDYQDIGDEHAREQLRPSVDLPAVLAHIGSHARGYRMVYGAKSVNAYTLLGHDRGASSGRLIGRQDEATCPWTPSLREVEPLMSGPLDPFSCLTEVELFADLSAQEIAAMDKMAPARLFRRGELLFSQSQPVTALFILKSGRVRVVRVAEDGKALRRLNGSYWRIRALPSASPACSASRSPGLRNASPTLR